MLFGPSKICLYYNNFLAAALDESSDSSTKSNGFNPTKAALAPKKSRLTRKSLGEYFTHSPLPFRRSSLFPKSSSVATLPLKPRHTHPVFNGLVPNSLLSSPEDELPPVIPEEEAEEVCSPTWGLKLSVGETKKRMEVEEKFKTGPVCFPAYFVTWCVT